MDIVSYILEHNCVYLPTLLDAYLISSQNQREFCSFLACQRSNLPPRLMEAIQQRCDWADVSFTAANTNNKEFILNLVEAKVVDWNSGLDGACAGKHIELIKYMISHGAQVTVDTLILAGHPTDTTALEYLFSYLNDEQLAPFFEHNPFLRVLTRISNTNVVKWLLKRISHFALPLVFRLACQENGKVFAEAIMNDQQLKGFISRKDIEISFNSACLGGHIEMIHFLIGHGARGFQEGLRYAVINYRLNVLRLMKKYGAEDEGLLAEHEKRMDKIRNYLNSVLCRDILTSLIEFIDIEYEGEMKRIQYSIRKVYG